MQEELPVLPPCSLLVQPEKNSCQAGSSGAFGNLKSCPSAPKETKSLTPSREQEEWGEGRSQEVGCTLLISPSSLPWGTLGSSSQHFPQVELVRVAGGKPCL